MFGFFKEVEQRAAQVARPRGRIPIDDLGKMGCRACPRDQHRLKNPKLWPTGDAEPSLYVLGAETTDDEDQHGQHFGNRYGQAVRDHIDDRITHVRFGNLVHCADKDVNAATRLGRDVDGVVSACCRPRVVADIESTNPLVVLGVGDAVLKWVMPFTAGGFTNAMTYRGRLMPARIGKWVGWFYCVAFPDFAGKRQRSGRRDEYEHAFAYDMAVLSDLVLDGLPPAVVEQGPYDAGIELIEGNKPGDLDRLDAALKRIARLPRAGLDLESTGLRPYAHGARILTMAVGVPGNAVSFALDDDRGWQTQRQRREAWGLVTDYLRNSGEKVCHHLAMEMEWLQHTLGPDILRTTQWACSMAMAHTLDHRRGMHSLAAQTVLEFGFNVKDQSPVDVKRENWWTLWSLPEILRYNGMDLWCSPLADRLESKLRNISGQWEQYERKARTVPTLVLTQALGLHADKRKAAELSADITKKARALEGKIQASPEVVRYTRAKGAFMPGSPDSVLDLMKYLGRDEIKRVQRDKTVKFSTDDEALSAMPAAEVPSARMILDLRGLEKLDGTYLQPIILGKIVMPDGMVHNIYSQFTAETSRLASEDPNVQNYPKRKNRFIRGVIYTPRGVMFVSIDLGQVEFRVFAMASEDEAVMRACWTDYDVHGHWAQRMVDIQPDLKDWIVKEFDVDWDEKGLKTLRQESKNGWVFPQFFGSSLDSVATRLHLKASTAEKLDGEFWDTFAGVKKWQSRQLKFYDRNLYVETLDGHRRYGPLTKNQIINLPIQGTAARLNIDAMNALSELAQLRDDWQLHPVLNVHDDITNRMNVEIAKDAAGKYQITAGLARVEDMVKEMVRIRHSWVNVPLLAEVSVGNRWDEMHEIAKYRSDRVFGHTNPYAKENA